VAEAQRYLMTHAQQPVAPPLTAPASPVSIPRTVTPH